MKVAEIILVLFIGMSSCGDAVKIAYADNNQLFNDFELTKELTEKLKEKELASQLTLDSLKFELVELKKAIEANEKPEANLMKNHQLLYNEFLTKEKAFTDSNKELGKQYDEQIMKQLNGLIKSYSKENKINVLLGTGNSNLLYAEEEMNVTEAIITYSNLKYKGK